MGRKSTSRTSRGCWECKRSHLKCEGQRPSCRRCRTSGKHCDYGLRLVWQDRSLVQDTGHGRKTLREQLPQLTKHHHCQVSQQRYASSTNNRMAFLNTTQHDVESYFESVHCVRASPARVFESEKGWRPLPLEANGPDSRLDNPSSCSDLRLYRVSCYPAAIIGEIDPALLAYYEAVICSSSTLLDDADNNPYRHFILPMAMQFESIFHAVLAVSAQILSISDASYKIAALEHSLHATRALSEALRNSQESGLRETQVLTLILCWMDITNHSSPTWLTHLYGMQSMLSQSQRTTSKSNSNSFDRFLTRYFAFHWVLARTAFVMPQDVVAPSSLDNSLSADNTRTSYDISCTAWTQYLSLQMPLEQMDKIDPYMGMSNSLLLLLNEIAEIYQEPPSILETRQREALSIRFRRIQNSLEGLIQSPPHSGRDVDQQPFLIIAEANRLGALLYLHIVGTLKSPRFDLDRGTASTTIFDADNGNSDDATGSVNTLARRILELIEDSFELVVRSAAMPLWPLFVAGCSSTDDADRIRVSLLFDRIEGMKRFGNITPARQVVQCVWKQHDLNVQDDRKRRKTLNEIHGWQDHYEIQHEKLLTWEFAMKMLGDWKLSLT